MFEKFKIMFKTKQNSTFFFLQFFAPYEITWQNLTPRGGFERKDDVDDAWVWLLELNPPVGGLNGNG